MPKRSGHPRALEGHDGWFLPYRHVPASSAHLLMHFMYLDLCEVMIVWPFKNDRPRSRGGNESSGAI